MLKWFEELQNKPVEYRKKVALSVTLAFTLIIIAVWISVILTNFRSDDDLNLAKDATNPMDYISDSVSSVVDSVRGLF
jgi:hypothetical protein